jgi:hypothetical protein
VYLLAVSVPDDCLAAGAQVPDPVGFTRQRNQVAVILQDRERYRKCMDFASLAACNVESNSVGRRDTDARQPRDNAIHAPAQPRASAVPHSGGVTHPQSNRR